VKRTLFAVPVAVLSLLVWQSSPASAQTKTARGTVTAVSNDSVTVKVADKDMKFTVDAKTEVTAPGAGTRTRQAQAGGASGAKISEVVSVGKAVEVHYTESGGTMHATSIRQVASAGSGGGSVREPAPPSKMATGTVKSVSPTSLVISDGGKDSTFTIDAESRVVGRGASTATRESGGRAPITQLVGVGDRVSVTYHEMGGAMHASNVQVTQKAAK